MLYSRAIINECQHRSRSTFNLIGASFGGFLAHHIATASDTLAFPPLCLIVLDPLPLLVVVAAGDPVTHRYAALSLLTLQLASVIQISDHSEPALSLQDSELESMVSEIESEIADWPEEQIDVRVAARLAMVGLRQFSFESVLRVGRQLRVLAQGMSFTQQPSSRANLTQCSSVGWDTLLMIASRRIEFFAAATSATEASIAAARAAYGKIVCEIVCCGYGGGHLVETLRCATGENVAVVALIQRFLEARDAPADDEQTEKHSF
jgi:hypothetical protein